MSNDLRSPDERARQILQTLLESVPPMPECGLMQHAGIDDLRQQRDDARTLAAALENEVARLRDQLAASEARVAALASELAGLAAATNQPDWYVERYEREAQQHRATLADAAPSEPMEISLAGVREVLGVTIAEIDHGATLDFVRARLEWFANLLADDAPTKREASDGD